MILLEEVSLRYRIARGAGWSLKSHVIRKLKGEVTYEERRAVENVSFQVSSGECVGLIGHNGAGKSTICKLIARVHRPTLGRILVEGSVAPLLELGLGFNPELTGRENVFLQGALMGFSRRDMTHRIPRILEFAELENNAFEAPIRTYSMGMVARLAFSVATDVDPDVLLVDEALSVGDERFQAKCQKRMGSFRERRKTVVIVSHSLEQIRAACQRVLWIDHGRLVTDGPVEQVTAGYHEWSSREPSDALEFAETHGLRGSQVS